MIDLDLGERLLQTVLDRFAFFQREAEIVGIRSVYTPVNRCNFRTLLNATGADNLNPDLHPQLCHQRALPGKGPFYLKVLTPTVFPPPR